MFNIQRQYLIFNWVLPHHFGSVAVSYIDSVLHIYSYTPLLV